MGHRRCRPRILQERLLVRSASWCLSRNIAADGGAANCESADARGVAGGERCRLPRICAGAAGDGGSRPHTMTSAASERGPCTAAPVSVSCGGG